MAKHDPARGDDLPILVRRRIEAGVIKPIYEEMVAALGAEQARAILAKAIVKDAIEHGKSYADRQDRPNDLDGFAALLPQWQEHDALQIDFLEQSDETLDFNVTRCRYAEMYRELGLAHIGDLLSCGRDGSFCTGYNPDIDLTRSQTIMQGASHCDFRYKMRPSYP
jgi:hypothetical protein